MVKKRVKANYYRYVIVSLVVVIMLIITLFIQFYDEKEKVGYFANELKYDDLTFQNLVTQRQYINYLLDKKSNLNETPDCNNIKKSFAYSINSMYDLTNKLSSYLENKDFVWKEYSYLRQRLINSQIEYWLLANKIKNTCDSAMVPVIYFFFEEKTCSNCRNEAVILNYLRLKSNNSLIIFSLDGTFGGTMNLFKNRYNLSNNSTSVLIGDKDLYSFLTTKEAKVALCKYENSLNFCEN